MPARLSFTAIRYADAADIPLIEGIERAGDTRFAEVSRARGIDPGLFPGVGMPGPERAASPGLVLVAGQPAVGFAHIVPVAGCLVLEQLSVSPDAGRRGVGGSLLHAAMGAALDMGHDTLYLRTFAEVPWNAPFYARSGFLEIPDPEWIAPLVAAEDGAGLRRWGRRITMACPLADEPVPRPAVSVIPLKDSPRGLEAFVQYRVSTMDFAAGAVVFPGGRVDPVDHDAAITLPQTTLDEQADRWAATDFRKLGARPSDAARTILATGVREVREEAAAVIDPATLIPWDNWVTPTGISRRFDVYFLIAPVNEGAAGEWRHTTSEAHDSHWTPVEALAERAERGELLLLPPTRAIVDEFLALGDLSSVLALTPAIRAVRHDIDIRRPRGG